MVNQDKPNPNHPLKWLRNIGIMAATFHIDKATKKLKQILIFRTYKRFGLYNDVREQFK